MDNIIEPNKTFDFSNLTLSHPVGIQGGAYFTKIEYNKKPLYIQTTKSLTRQGLVKTGKKYYCDLMFDKNSEDLIQWFENLEEKCQKLIYEKKDDWFQGNLEESDIETAFNSLLRVYKSGKYYLLRTNIKNSKDDVPSIKIYNENEIPLGISDITNETQVISILEIQGIKFTSRNFQIEIEIKQIMVLDNEPIFENCLIKSNKKPLEQASLEEMGNQDSNPDSNLKDIIVTESIITNDIVEQTSSEVEKKPEEIKITENLDNLDNLDNLEEMEPLDLLQDENKKEENISLNIDFEDLMEDIQENNDEVLKEIDNDDLNLEKPDEFITLKKPNEVYFNLYKEARTKAKQAKKSAILAYLEAKNIKKTYMLENINDSDSDFDAEIDEASESELEGL